MAILSLAWLMRRSPSIGSRLHELPSGEIVHRQRRGVRGDLREMLALAPALGRQPQLAHAPFDRTDERLYERALDTRPVGDLVDEGLARLAQQLRGGAHPFLAALGDAE